MSRLIIALCLINVVACKSHVRHKSTDNKRSAGIKENIKKEDLRVIKGEDIIEGEYPYTVILILIIKMQNPTDKKLYVTFKRFCTASMITEYWALTAAHCPASNGIPIYIWYRNFTTSPLVTKLISKVTEIVRHPAFKLSNNIIVNDIALLRVVERIDMKMYGRMLSADFTALMGLPVVYLGGGGTLKDRYLDDLKQMQIGEGILMACTKANIIPELFGYIKLHPMICVSSKCSNRKLGVWYGDSGGPLIHDGYIIGVASLRLTVVKEGGVFTPVSPFLDWISNVIRPNH